MMLSDASAARSSEPLGATGIQDATGAIMTIKAPSSQAPRASTVSATVSVRPFVRSSGRHKAVVKMFFKTICEPVISATKQVAVEWKLAP
jgi:hypothetical protein